MVIVNIKNNHPKLFYVKDTQLFIKKFCKFIIDSYKGKIIAVTGSVGKTTFKENIYHILKNNNIKHIDLIKIIIIFRVYNFQL